MSSYYVDYGSKSVQTGKSSDCYAYAMLRALRVPLTRRSAVHILEIWPVYAQISFESATESL